MNAWPEWDEWLRLLGTITIEVTLVFAVAQLIVRRIQSVVWRKTLWQIAFVTMLLASLGELNGVWSWFARNREVEAARPERVFTIVTSGAAETLSAGQATARAAEVAEAVTLDAHAPSRWNHWPPALWLAGMILIILRILLGLVLTVKFRLNSRRVRDAGVLDSIKVLRSLLRVRRPVVAAQGGRGQAPFTFGVVRPVIVLPLDFGRSFLQEKRDAALVHELAHVAAFDSAWRMAANVTCALLWWHPVVWMSRRALQEASELVADEASLLLVDGPSRLVECLLDCARDMTERRAPGIGMSDFRSGLGRRIARLMEMQHYSPRVISRFRLSVARVVAPLLFTIILWCGMAASSAEKMTGSAGWRSSMVGTIFTAMTRGEARAELPGDGAESERQKNPTAPTRQAAEVTFSAEDDGSAATNELHTRFFRVDVNTLLPGLRLVLKPVVGSEDASDEMIIRTTLESFCKSAGADFSAPGKAIFFNDRLGILTVRATLRDLDIVEKAVAMLNVNPPQMKIEVIVVEVERPSELDWLFAHSTQQGSHLTSREPAGIITPEQFRAMLAVLEKKDRTVVTRMPSVTTINGRQAQIKMVEVRHVVTDISISTNVVAETNATVFHPVAEPFELGPVIDVVPLVQPDGYSIRMTVVPTLREFLGYADPGNAGTHDARTTWATGGPFASRGAGQSMATPLPKFRLRQATASAIVRDGQTLVVAATDYSKTNQAPADLVFFVTPRLIDSTGNPIHSDEDLAR